VSCQPVPRSASARGAGCDACNRYAYLLPALKPGCKPRCTSPRWRWVARISPEESAATTLCHEKVALKRWMEVLVPSVQAAKVDYTDLLNRSRLRTWPGACAHRTGYCEAPRTGAPQDRRHPQCLGANADIIIQERDRDLLKKLSNIPSS